MTACSGCGHDLLPASPNADHCSDCPPWTCETCGETCSTTDLCPCWTPLDTLPLADVKALFAGDDLSLDHKETR